MNERWRVASGRWRVDLVKPIGSVSRTNYLYENFATRYSLLATSLADRLEIIRQARLFGTRGISLRG